MQSTLKKLRNRIVVLTVLVEATTLFAILFILNYSLKMQEQNLVHSFLIELSAKDGRMFEREKIEDEHLFPDDEPPTFDKNFDLSSFREYFSVETDEIGRILRVESDFPLIYTLNEIRSMVALVIDDVLKDGDFGDGITHGIRYYVRPLGNGHHLISVVNRRGEYLTLKRLRRMSVFVLIISIFVSFIISFAVSLLIIRPAQLVFNRQKEFIADAGHELKTPIAVIGANLDVLESDFSGNRWLGYIRAENERMGKLVKNLLYLAKNDYVKTNIHFAQIDFSAIVKNATLPFESVFFEQEKNLKIDVQKSILLFGDELQLKQVVMILVDNALKNSEKGADVFVRAFVDEKKAILKVKNTGAGISKNDLEKIFERFYRGDSSRTRKTGGYGLGLSIARAIAEAHKGTLFAESRFGEWAEFTLSIPIRSPKKRKFFIF